jgi:Spy/CpxP family protein refolding chaperone
MRKTPKVLAAVAMLSLLSLPLVAQSAVFELSAQAAVPNFNDSDNLLHHPRLLAKYLGLTADQNTQFQALWKTLQTSVDTIRKARAPLCQQLRTDLNASTPDTTVVGTDSINLFENKQQIRAAHLTFDTAFTAILTPDQVTKYNNLKEITHIDNGPGTDILGECPPPPAS